MEQGTKPSEWDFISFLLSEADEETKIWKSLVEEELLMNEKREGGGVYGETQPWPQPQFKCLVAVELFIASFSLNLTLRLSRLGKLF